MGKVMVIGIAGGTGSGKTTVKPMHEAYVEPSKRHADIIVFGDGSNQAALDLLVNRIRMHLSAE